MKTRHDDDCTIYVSLVNIGMPEAGICTCGYGHQYKYTNTGDDSELYSQELLNKLENKNKVVKDVFVTNKKGSR